MVRCLRSLRFHDLIEAMSGWIERGPWLRRWERKVGRKSAKPLKAYCERGAQSLASAADPHRAAA